MPEQGDPTANLRNLLNRRPHPRIEGLSLSSVSPDNINKIIKGLKNSKSCGLDNLDTFIIKLIRPYIVPSITHIVNISISTEEFPSLYKRAKVVPLHKGKDAPATQPKSYRPVSILPVISKIIERVIQTQITDYMNRAQLLHPNHHAYRTFHSTTSAMLSMHDSWVEAAERGELAGVAMIDMSAAFDVVDIKLLLEKCKLLNFENNTLKWLSSYLTGRQQAVYIGGFLSPMLSLEAGVPQGSILGPLLYTVYTVDFPEVVHQNDCPHNQEEQAFKFRTMCTECGGIVCYADDSTYTATARTTDELSNKLNTKYKVMSEYLTENRLCINSDKTHLLLMSTKQKKRKNKDLNISLNTGNEIITTSRTETLLGFQIHENMGFSEHVIDSKHSLVKTLNKQIGALKKIKKAASFKSKLNIATGIIMSKILYLLPLYCGCPEYMLTALQTKQSETMRLVTGRRWVVPGRKLVSTKELLKQCNWLSIRQLSFYTTVLTTHNTLVYQTPEVLYEKLTCGQKQTTRATTNQEMERSYVDEAQLSLAATSWRWRGHQLHSKIPLKMQIEKNLKIFKLQLKSWVRENVPI